MVARLTLNQDASVRIREPVPCSKGEKMFQEFCSFIEDIYGGSHKIITTPMGLKILRIENGADIFQIYLADKERFGKWKLYHRNHGRFLDGSYGWHLQIECNDLSYAMFVAYKHSFDKENDLWSRKEDYKRFITDWRRYCEQII